MLTLILQSLWSDFKKHWLNFSILFALWTICYFTFGFSTPSASIGLGLAFVLLLSVKLPIRSLKALSFCPADTKIKRRLLLMYLLVKILICLLIFSLFQILGGGFHYWIITVTPRETITNLLLLLLLIIAACLNHAMPSPIQLTEEGHQQKIFNRILNFDFLNFIWILLLVAEFALFKYASPKNILWFLIMSINILVTAYCIHSFLNSILSYETCFELQDLTERRPGTH